LRAVSAFFFNPEGPPLFAVGADHDFAERNAFGPDELRLVLFVKFFRFRFRNVNVRADFLPDHFLRDEMAANVVLEVFPVQSLRVTAFSSASIWAIVLNADLSSCLITSDLDADAHVLAALTKSAWSIKSRNAYFLRSSCSRQLLRGAAILAFLLGIFFSGGQRFIVSDFVMISLFTRAMISSTTLPPDAAGLPAWRQPRGRRLRFTVRFGRGRRWGFKFRLRAVRGAGCAQREAERETTPLKH